jgi:hypothetical protein
MTSSAEVRARWLTYLHSTEPADRARAEAGVRAIYTAAGFVEPRYALWYPSPCAASLAIAALVPKEDSSSAQLLDPGVLSTDDRKRLDRARSDLRERVGATVWEQVVAAVGDSKAATMRARLDPSRTFAPAFVEARFAGVEDFSSLFTAPDEDDALARAESHFWGSNRGVLTSAIHCRTTNFLIGRSFFDEQTFSSLADVEARADGGPLHPLILAAREVACSSGLWWPYEHAVILSDRPSEIYVNDRLLPHREDGPAVVYRDGWEVFAWNGKAVPERWITATETVPPGEYRGFDPSFGKWAKSKGAPTRGARKRAKPAAVTKLVLPADPAARLEQLRAHAGGQLPLFERYVAGEHRDVWRELVALGAAVREDAHAADALAVAYETMRRVDTNLRTLIERLTAIGYRFTPNGAGQSAVSRLSGGLLDMLAWTRDMMRGGASQGTPQRVSQKLQPHVPPGPNAAREVADFEKEFGVLPLSLRAFYEVVGEVNLIGNHPTLDPPGNAIATDPLVVYGLDVGALEYDEEGDEEGAPSAITIAPDDLHKANVSGGDPYTMTFPDPRADGELIDERHGVFFVDYLRLCFEFGGFPGYEGKSAAPPELRALADGLVGF